MSKSYNQKPLRLKKVELCIKNVRLIFQKIHIDVSKSYVVTWVQINMP